MSIPAPNLKAFVTATLLIVTSGIFTPVYAQAGMGEAELLSGLANAGPAEAAGFDRELQALWSKSGSPAMDLLLRRGRDAQERGDIREAIEHLTALTDHAPEFAEGWHARAAAFFAIGLYGPALADLERALYLNPKNYNAIFGLGAMFEQFEDFDRAFEAYSRAQAIHPNHDEVTTALDRLKPLVEGEEL